MELAFPYDQLYKNINAIYPLSEKTWEAFAAAWRLAHGHVRPQINVQALQFGRVRVLVEFIASTSLPAPTATIEN